MKFAVFALSALALAACTQDSKSSSPDPEAPIRAKIMAPVQTSPEAIEEIKVLIRRWAAKIPDLKVLIEPAHSAKSNANDSLDAYGRELLERIKRDCDVDKGQEDTSLPTRSRTQSISGSNCPIDFSKTTKWSENYSEKTATNQNGTARAEVETRQQIRDKSLQKVLGVVEYQGRDMTNASYESVRTENGRLLSGRISYVMSATGTSRLANDKTVLHSYEYASVIQPGRSSSSNVSVSEWPQGKMVFGKISDGEKDEYFFNGQKTTKEELKREFGIDW